MKNQINNNFLASWFTMLMAIAFLLISTNLYAFEIAGTWKLISIERKDNNQWKPDCHSPTGLLIYTDSGYMAAGVNCMLAKKTAQPSFDEKDMTFYMGTYSLKQNSIIHHVINANSTAYYGKDLMRKIQIISDDKINLLVKNKRGQIIRLQWKRISSH